MPRTLAEIGTSCPDVRLVAHAVVPEHFDIDGWWREPQPPGCWPSEYVKYVVAVARMRLDPEGGTSAVATRLATARDNPPAAAALRQS